MFLHHIDGRGIFVSGGSGLPGFPGRPGAPGETVGSDVPGPVGDPGLPGLDGEYGKYVSSSPVLAVRFLFPFLSFSCLSSPFLLTPFSSWFFRFSRSPRTSRATWSRHSSGRQR